MYKVFVLDQEEFLNVIEGLISLNEETQSDWLHFKAAEDRLRDKLDGSLYAYAAIARANAEAKGAQIDALLDRINEIAWSKHHPIL